MINAKNNKIFDFLDLNENIHEKNIEIRNLLRQLKTVNVSLKNEIKINEICFRILKDYIYEENLYPIDTSGTLRASIDSRIISTAMEILAIPWIEYHWGNLFNACFSNKETNKIEKLDVILVSKNKDKYVGLDLKGLTNVENLNHNDINKYCNFRRIPDKKSLQPMTSNEAWQDITDDLTCCASNIPRFILAMKKEKLESKPNYSFRTTHLFKINGFLSCSRAHRLNSNKHNPIIIKSSSEPMVSYVEKRYFDADLKEAIHKHNKNLQSQEIEI